ncbi:MAG TPA: hypothetical protein VF676_06875 [Flavobacterium sp.]|jgi:hypothetical protein
MKYFGFIKEHEDADYAVSMKDLIGESNCENPHRAEVLSYLEKGKLCVPFMGCVENANDPNFDTELYDDDDFIAYLAIDTDGNWYWPRYIVTYLEKYPNMKIDCGFVTHVMENANSEIRIPNEEISKLEKEYLEKAGFKKNDRDK